MKFNNLMQFAFCALISASSATTLTVGTDDTWGLSTSVVTSAGIVSWGAGDYALTPPDASTFTDPSVVSTSTVVAPAATSMGVDALYAGSDIRYYRQTFNIPVELVQFEGKMTVAVDNDIAVWINGNLVAAETSLSTSNWASPFISLDFNSDGDISNVVKFDQVASNFPAFTAGQNEVILAVRNLSGTDQGGVAFKLDVTSVPEPSTGLLSLLGGLALLRRKRA